MIYAQFVDCAENGPAGHARHTAPAAPLLLAWKCVPAGHGLHSICGLHADVLRHVVLPLPTCPGRHRTSKVVPGLEGAACFGLFPCASRIQSFLFTCSWPQVMLPLLLHLGNCVHLPSALHSMRPPPAYPGLHDTMAPAPYARSFCTARRTRMFGLLGSVLGHATLRHTASVVLAQACEEPFRGGFQAPFSSCRG